MNVSKTPKILVLGATSALSQACIRLWAKEGAEFYLVARDQIKLNTVLDDLKLRAPATRAHSSTHDLANTNGHAEIFARALSAMGGLDRVLVCFGILGNESSAQEDFELAKKVIELNFVAHASLLLQATKNLEGGAGKSLVVVTSVAGERGRASNFVYGSSKAGLIAFVSGLRAKNSAHNLHIMDVRPGLMDSPMTEHFSKKGLLWSSPERVARSIVCGLKCQRDIVYAPGFWCGIMWIIRHIPERIFKRLKF